jgi:hypothetical protein
MELQGVTPEAHIEGEADSTLLAEEGGAVYTTTVAGKGAGKKFQ